MIYVDTSANLNEEENKDTNSPNENSPLLQRRKNINYEEKEQQIVNSKNDNPLYEMSNLSYPMEKYCNPHKKVSDLKKRV